MCEYNLKTELKNINFQALTANDKMPCLQRCFQHGCQRIFPIGIVNYFIVFLICSNIKHLSVKICGPYEMWGEVLYIDTWFSGFIHSCHDNCYPSLWGVNFSKNCQDQSVFSGVLGCNSNSALSCIVEGNGLKVLCLLSKKRLWWIILIVILVTSTCDNNYQITMQV